MKENEKKQKPQVIKFPGTQDECTVDDDELEASIEEMKFNSNLFGLFNLIGVGELIVGEIEEIAARVYAEESDSKMLTEVFENWVAFRESFNRYFTSE